MRDTKQEQQPIKYVNGANIAVKQPDHVLFSALWQQLTPQGSDWLKTAQHQLTLGDNEQHFDEFLKFSAMAKRKLGSALLINVTNPAAWQVDQAARLLLLLNLLSIKPSTGLAPLVRNAFKFGDESEQIAIIKGLSLIDHTGVLTDLAIATGRTNSLNLFAAIALNNDYPANHYEQRAYHQLVLKALFMDLDISQIIGLQQRKCPQLSALAIDLVNERLAADRQPPGSIWLAIDPEHLTTTDLAIFLRFNGSN